MRILLVNDDGIDAEGIRALVDYFRHGNDVVVAAPAENQSGMAHAISVRKKIQVEHYSEYEKLGVEAWKIHGTPSDCVKIYLEAMCEKDKFPDLVISGINHGANLGSDVLYSGTVGGAIEGFVHGIPSIAVSLEIDSKIKLHDVAEKLAVELPRFEEIWGKNFLLNVNFPKKYRDGVPKFVTSSVGHRDYLNAFEKIEEDGNVYYYMAGEIYDGENKPETDIRKTDEGFISVTPLQLDMTNKKAYDACRNECHSL